MSAIRRAGADANVYDNGVGVIVDTTNGFTASFPPHPSIGDAYEAAYAWALQRCETVILLTPRFVAGSPPADREVERYFRKPAAVLSVAQRAALARMLYPGRPFDTELPEHFVASAHERGFDPTGVFVWGYKTQINEAQPLPLVREAVWMLHASDIAA